MRQIDRITFQATLSNQPNDKGGLLAFLAKEEGESQTH